MKIKSQEINESGRRLETLSVSKQLHQTQDLLIEAISLLQKIWQTNMHSSPCVASCGKQKQSHPKKDLSLSSLDIKHKGFHSDSVDRELWKNRF